LFHLFSSGVVEKISWRLTPLPEPYAAQISGASSRIVDLNGSFQKKLKIFT